MADENTPTVTYELPVLDITAVLIAVIAVIIALMSLYLANQTRMNTNNTVIELQLNREELVKIKFILARISQQAEGSTANVFTPQTQGTIVVPT
jgi:hypothetical protein